MNANHLYNINNGKMKNNKISRRKFLTSVSTAALVGTLASNKIYAFDIMKHSTTNKLAILGGTSVRANKIWPSWPYVDEKVVEAVDKTARSGIWCRIDPGNHNVTSFEKAYAQLMGTKYCVSTGSGTQALHTSVEALGIGPGDEIITTPYTDMGTIASILAARALPVLADIDRESFQFDPDDVERRINENTKAITAVHMMGQPCNMDRIMEIANKYHLYVIEDACQAHLASFRGKKVGTIGNLGCFSHQTSKVLSCGEGGSIIGNDEELMDRCFTVMNHGTNRHGHSVTIGPKYRMNEFQAAILLAEMEKAVSQWKLRNENAVYLTSRLKECPGVVPQKLYEGTDSGSYYLYTMGYRKEYFNNVSREVFMRALGAEGVGISPYLSNGLHREPWVDHIIGLKVYQKMYSAERLKRYKEEMTCPVCDRVCNEMLMLWSSGPLLGTKSDMDDIANAIMKLYENRDQLTQIKG
jgi:perosamine synthetase